MGIPRPEVLSYDELRHRAAEFLDRHWPSGKIPVDVEEIADLGLGIDIVPVPDLLATADVDGFLSADGSEICVDESVFRHRLLYRYRFTIAHELAHLHLHRELFRAATFRSVEEWKRFQASIPEEHRSWYEWQAYSFAGLILVPPESLAGLIHTSTNKGAPTSCTTGSTRASERARTTSRSSRPTRSARRHPAPSYRTAALRRIRSRR